MLRLLACQVQTQLEHHLNLFLFPQPIFTVPHTLTSSVYALSASTLFQPYSHSQHLTFLKAAFAVLSYNYVTEVSVYTWVSAKLHQLLTLVSVFVRWNFFKDFNLPRDSLPFLQSVGRFIKSLDVSFLAKDISEVSERVRIIKVD